MQGILKGKHIRLTSFTEDDLPIISNWYEDDEFLRYLDAIVAYPRSKISMKKWLEEAQKDEGKRYPFAVRPLENNTLIGYVELEGILWNHQTAWLAVGIGDPTNRNKGYGSEAIKLLLKFAFHELNLRRIQLSVFGYNERAIALYEKLGFKREGAFREFLHRDGELYDMYIYGLLRKEWKAIYLSND